MVRLVLKGNISKVCEDLTTIAEKSKANGITKVVELLNKIKK